MKVLYLAESLSPASGWGRFSREIIVRAIARGVDATILVERASGFPGEIAMLKRSWRTLLIVPALRRLIREGQFDVINSMEVNPYGIAVWLATLGMRVPQVITATGAYSVRPLYQMTTALVTRAAYRAAAAVLCISTYVEEEIRRVVPLKNLATVTLGVDAKVFAGERIMPEQPFILTVGNLAYRKGYHVSVAAFAQIAKEFPSLHYLIAGRVDSYVKRLCDVIINEHELKDRVIFLGPQDDAALKRLYLSAELFVLTAINEDYHFEGFGLVFLEAAAAGLPVIGTTGNGIRDAVSEGKNGLLVPQHDVDATATAMRTLLSDATARKRFSCASIAWARENSWDRTVDRYMGAYTQAYGG